MFVCTAAVTRQHRAVQLVYNKTVLPPHFMHWVKSRWSETPLDQIIFFYFVLYLLREYDGGRLAV